MASKKSLETTGHNISNANTEGYSRQRVEQQAYPPLRVGNVVMGRGTDVKTVKRIHDELLEKRLTKAQTQTSFHDERASLLSQVEQIFNEVDGDGLNKLLNGFFNSFRELANEPENDTLREIVRDKATLIVKDFHRVDDRLMQVRSTLENRIFRSVDSINALTEQIGKLNIQITQMEMNDNAVASDLRDGRDKAVQELSEYFDLKTYEDEKGNFVVNAEGVGSIVIAGNTIALGATAVKESNDINDPGSMQIFFRDRPNIVVTDQFEKGVLQAAIKTRNEELDHVMQKVDDLAYNLANAVNAIHKRGFINKPLPVDAQGQPYNEGTYKKVTGINFFETPTSAKYAARNLKLGELVKESSDYIAAALSPNAPADNRIALALTKLQHEKFANGGTATFEEEYLKTVGHIGVKTAKENITAEHAKGIKAQIRTMKERISGVSLDEEAANLVKYQHQYQANAKVIQQSEEMFNAILNIMR